jgi:drug/metabolite transporter (DMT)-like permease
VPLVPLVIIETLQHNFINTLSIQGIIGAIYGVLLSTIIGHMLFAYGVRYIRTSEVGIFGYIDPIATVLIAYPLLGEGITISFILGALFVFLGIYLAEGRIHYHPLHLLRAKENSV